MLKRQITKAEHAALVPALQVEYKAETGGELFTLDATGFDDPAELRRARDREKDKADQEKARADTEKARAETEKARADAQQAKLEALGPDAQAKLRDITSLERSWQEKLTSEVGKRDAALGNRDRFINTLLIDNVAQSMASEIAGDNAAILIPHIRQRLQVEHVEGANPITRVLDATGKPSAFSVEDLKKEFQNDKRFAVVVIGSKGSGAGGNGRQAAGSGGQGGGQKKFGELNDKERTEWFRRDPAGFKEASQANQRELAEAR